MNFETDRVTVPSPKTEHHEGRAYRVIPLFPELRPYLEESFDLAQLGGVYCLSRHRGEPKNFGTQLQRIVRRAGLKPWEKPWQNMRSTRGTELITSLMEAWEERQLLRMKNQLAKLDLLILDELGYVLAPSTARRG